ncbi:MAG: adenylyltransferase/cytidyltransferase family protein [Veillonella sp.]|uniref:adenylyltransferase/cytidyltransferase family protein n=1 Tax=Veillonella sp. TaxID=1926307 RepID=UPI0029064779|nr:adenylyltransferase/cytidyltransferase family protein [Veillonella sp.]MDU3564076.1 adenylyltransferase/cytidyltransferase family protein [Veillonella sp.]
MKKVITYGTYDLFHEGHYNLLKNAKALGDYLIVGVTSGDFDKNRGKLNVRDSLMTRIKNVEETGFADEIIIEEYFGQKIDDIKKYDVDIFTVGSDWKGHFDYLNEYCEVIYLDRTKGISSTEIRNTNTIKLGCHGVEQVTARFLEEAKYVSGMDTGAVYVENKPDYLDKLVEDYELKVYPDQEAFYDAIDAVYIVVEPKYQFQAIMNALKHKKHVLVEFPILVTDEQLQEITYLADANGCIFMEGLKTAYTPAFGKLIALAKSGIIGNILSVDANFTQILGKQLAEQIRLVDGGSVNALASYPFLAFVKFLGLDYKDIQFFSRNDDQGLDMFTKILVSYENAVATSNVAISGKSEGDMIISGDKGYIYVPAPWWKTEYFEVRFEDLNMNRKYFYKFDGEGLRYEISEFIQCILNKKNSILLTIEEIRAITKMINQFNVANKVTF